MIDAPTQSAPARLAPWIGGVAVDGAYAYFPLEDASKTTVYRVAK